MKGVKELFTDVNFILRLIEFVICILTLIFYQNGVGLAWVITIHGWTYLSFFYIVSYVVEDQTVWTEAFALGLYIALSLLTALLDLSKHCIMPFILAAVLIADLVILVITKRE
ncbi:uncharacterized protein LOC143175289 [Nomia melanderi]|uniref:uncharacterized protein LOC143175289 n=1 Tax=Nomia melanderi TaxID=2448451 RepID=UPI003FCE31C9